MIDHKWKYHIRAEKLPVILCLIMFAIFGGITVWLYCSGNGAFLFTGLLAMILLALVLATLFRLLFFRVSVGPEGFFYQTNPLNGAYHSYREVAKAWSNQGTAQNGARQEFCNIELSGCPVIRFSYLEKDRKSVNYLIRRVSSDIENRPNPTDPAAAEYLIDGKVFGKTRFVICAVTLILLFIIDIAIKKATDNYLLLTPGVLVMGYVAYTLTIRYFFFQIRIRENGFYYRTNPFNGQEFLYREISDCRMVKRVVRIRRAREAEAPKYYFFFEFTDLRGKTRKFQYEKPIHGHEVQILKKRVEHVLGRSFGDEIVAR